MKKYIKLFSSIIACCLPLSLITYYAVPWNKYETISAAGSSALQPLMTEFSEKWESETDLIVQGGGSGFGMKSIATNSKDIGMASKNTYDSVQKASIQRNGYNKQTWEDSALKTITIGWDSIAIVYKIDQKYILDLRTDDGTLAKIYDMFSGRKKYYVSDFIQGANDNSAIVPYGRTGGANASGTATSFMYESTFDWNASYTQYGVDIKTAENALKSGSYLNNNVNTTNESNVESWNKVKYENLNNSMIYLSMSFALQNYDDLQKNGFRIATFEGVDPVEYLRQNGNLNTEFLTTYKWFSPFNIIINLSKPRKEVEEFVRWLFLSTQAKEIFDKQIIVTLDKNLDFLKAMLANQYQTVSTFEEGINMFFNIANSDINLEKEKPESTYYGIAKNVVLKDIKRQS